MGKKKETRTRIIWKEQPEIRVGMKITLQRWQMFEQKGGNFIENAVPMRGDARTMIEIHDSHMKYSTKRIVETCQITTVVHQWNGVTTGNYYNALHGGSSGTTADSNLSTVAQCVSIVTHVVGHSSLSPRRILADPYPGESILPSPYLCLNVLTMPPVCIKVCICFPFFMVDCSIPYLIGGEKWYSLPSTRTVAESSLPPIQCSCITLSPA